MEIRAFFPLAFAAFFASNIFGASEFPSRERSLAAPASTRESQKETVTLIAVGDVLPARGPGKLIAQHGNDFVFRNVAKELRAADIAFCNLECAISAREKKVRKTVAFRAAPQSVGALKNGGFDIVSLANNHALDCGPRGLTETTRHLRAAKIAFCGVKITREYSRITVLRRGKLRIAFAAFCDFLPQGVAENAMPNIVRAQKNEIENAMRQARSRADVAVASFHFGREYSQFPDARQKQLARLAVASGADLVLGHHPHVLQGFTFLPRSSADKTRHPALVAYSLGNFLFDSSRAFGKRPQQSLMVKCVLEARGVKSARMVAMQIEGFRPRPATFAETRAIVSRQNELSRTLGTRLDSGRIVSTQRN